MDFKTNVSLSSEQLADLFEIFAMTLRESKHIKIPLGNSEMTIDLAETLGLGIEFSQDKNSSTLTLSVQWTLEEKQPKEGSLGIPSAEPPVLNASNIQPSTPAHTSSPTSTKPPQIQSPQPYSSPPISSPVASSTTKLSDRDLPTRIQLETTTIGSNGGRSFVSAFSSTAPSKWRIVVGSPTANEKQNEEEEDLFASLETKMNMGKRKKKSAVEPLGLIPTAQSSSVDVDEKEILQWKEPTPEENVTDDDWKKPSELLKKTKETHEISPPNVPTPKTPTHSNIPPAEMKKPSYDLPPPPSIPAAKRPEGAPVPPDVKKKQEKKKDKKIGWSEWD